MAATDAVTATAERNAPPPIESPEVRIARSWQRSVEMYHLDPWRREAPHVLTAEALRERRERIGPLLDVARSGMQTLFRQVRDAGYVVLLTDPQGVAVDFIGNPALDRELHHAGLHLGGCWAEEYEGTCAVGLSLIDRRPITVHHGEHFRACNASLTCSAAPILAPDGSLLAVLDASALRSPDDRRSQHLVLQMVRSTAQLIEHAYFLRRYEGHWVLRIGSHREFLEVAADGLVALDAAGRIAAASQRFLQDAGGQMHALVGRRVEEVFGLRFGELLACAAREGCAPVELRLPQSGGRCFALLRHPHAARIPSSIDSGGSSAHRTAPAAPVAKGEVDADADVGTAAGMPSSAPPPGLARLAGNDTRLLIGAQQALRVIGKGIPVLLQGESGTGKEVFARALHAASPHGQGPFVALNCAAIPESLIESELFGYRDGAFTGARAKGARGLVAQADGGTLFLDEIGDMPLAMQTRLLRVLAEHEIVPLGGGRPVPVDLQVICATHRRLDALVESGRFRLDLYYRLNGLALTLPPLRDRHDKAALIDAVLAQEARSLRRALPRLAENARAVLLGYGWPGNLRQLKNALRAALALCDGDCIGLEHLPAEIAAAVGSAMPPARLSSLQLGEGIGAARPVPEAEREALLRVLRQHRWNVSQAARSLNTCRSTLYRRMQRHAIVAPNRRESGPDTEH